jgi:hypothetical protein
MSLRVVRKWVVSSSGRMVATQSRRNQPANKSELAKKQSKKRIHITLISLIQQYKIRQYAEFASNKRSSSHVHAPKYEIPCEKIPTSLYGQIAPTPKHIKHPYF